MLRRDFIKTMLASGMFCSTGVLPLLGRVANAAGFPAIGGRVLVNIMLSGGPDMRHLLPPEFNPDVNSYGYSYWKAKAEAHSIAQSTAEYQSRWDNDYYHIDGVVNKFGILKKCGWLKRMWDAGNVAVISNAIGGDTRNHSHCRAVMNQGNIDSKLNDLERSGWGGRLAAYSGGNVVALTRTPEPFAYGPHPYDHDKHDNRNLVGAGNTRDMTLYNVNDPLSESNSAQLSRSLSAYYAALGESVSGGSIYSALIELEHQIRAFGEPIDDRLATVPVPDSITGLINGVLSDPNIGEQIRNLHDCYVCSDILSMRVASLAVDGWDTHTRQRDVIEPKLEDLFGDGKALDVLYQELSQDAIDNTVFVIGGEFGRQLCANGGNGTDHGSGTSILIIGTAVQGGIYGDMFPEDELNIMHEPSPEIVGLTTVDSIYKVISDWVQPGAGNTVIPYSSGSLVEENVSLNALFI